MDLTVYITRVEKYKLLQTTLQDRINREKKDVLVVQVRMFRRQIHAMVSSGNLKYTDRVWIFLSKITLDEDGNWVWAKVYATNLVGNLPSFLHISRESLNQRSSVMCQSLLFLLITDALTYSWCLQVILKFHRDRRSSYIIKLFSEPLVSDEPVRDEAEMPNDLKDKTGCNCSCPFHRKYHGPG